MISKRKIVSSGIWSFVEKMYQQVVLFIVFIDTARIIGPAEIGLFSLIQVIQILASGVLLGLADAIIVKSKSEDDAHLSTTFWCIITVGLFISLLTWILALWISEESDNAQLADLIYLIGFCPLLIALGSVPTAVIHSNMNFKAFAVRSILSSTFGGFVAIIMARNGYGAISLVCQIVVQGFISNIIIWYSIKWRPSLKFSANIIKDIWQPGARSASSNIIESIETQLPRLILGLLVGPIGIGFYSVAARIWGSVRDIIFNPIGTAFLVPMIKSRDSSTRMGNLLFNLWFITALLWIPLFLSIELFGFPFFSLVFGDSWQDSYKVLQSLFAAFALRPFAIVFRVFSRANLSLGNYVRVQFYGMFLANIVFFLSLYLFQFSISQAILCWGFIDTITSLINIRNHANKHRFSFRPFINLFLRLTACSLLAIIVTFIAFERDADIDIAPASLRLLLFLTSYIAISLSLHWKYIKSLKMDVAGLV